MNEVKILFIYFFYFYLQEGRRELEDEYNSTLWVNVTDNPNNRITGATATSDCERGFIQGSAWFWFKNYTHVESYSFLCRLYIHIYVHETFSHEKQDYRPTVFFVVY